MEGLTREQAAKLGELWTTHKRLLHWRVRNQKDADEILSELGEVLSRPDVFGRLAPDYADDDFKRLASYALRIAALRLHKKRESYVALAKRVWRSRQNKRFASPTLEIVLRHEAWELVRQRLLEIKDVRRYSIVGFYLEGEADTERALQDGVSKQNCRQQRHRGLQDLRRILPESLDPVLQSR